VSRETLTGEHNLLVTFL